MPVLSLACHLPHNTPNIPSRYNNEQTTKQTKAINNSYIYISHVNVTQTVPDISPLMPMHQDPLLVPYWQCHWHRVSIVQPSNSLASAARFTASTAIIITIFGYPHAYFDDRNILLNRWIIMIQNIRIGWIMEMPGFRWTNVNHIPNQILFYRISSAARM